jgi:hypothetical protein
LNQRHNKPPLKSCAQSRLGERLPVIHGSQNSNQIRFLPQSGKCTAQKQGHDDPANKVPQTFHTPRVIISFRS